MNSLKNIKKIREYCNYCEEHLLNVHASWLMLQKCCSDMRFIWDDYFYESIGCDIRLHDVSKFSPEEFIQYQQAFFPVDGEDKKPLGDAWEHHKKNNSHHWENWTKKDYYFPNEWEFHCVHMIVDWMAMGLKFGDTAQEYYEKNKDKIDLPDYAVDFIYEIFRRLKNETNN